MPILFYNKFNKFFISLFIIFWAGCSSSKGMDFKLVKDINVVKPGTIAVVPGNLEDVSIVLARAIAQRLREKSKFEVMDFIQVYKKLDRQGPLIAGDEIKKEIGRINLLQSRLKTKYIFVVMASDMRKKVTSIRRVISNVTYFFSTTGLLIDYNIGKTIGYTDIRTSINGSCHCLNPFTWVLLFKSKGKLVIDAVEDASEEIADKIITETASSKH